MTLVARYPSGASEHVCQECGRRVLFNPDQRHPRTVLMAGDEDQVHTLVDMGDTPGFSLNMGADIYPREVDPD